MNSSIKLSVFVLFTYCLLVVSSVSAAQEGMPFINPAQSVSMDFQDANLKDILKIFSIQSGLSFIASDNVKDKKITLYLDKVGIKDAMDKLFMANGLAYTLDSDSHIFIVKDLGISEVEKITKVYYLKYHSVSSSTIIKESNATSASSSGSAAAASGIVSSIKAVLSKDGVISEEPRNNCLIVTDIPSVFTEVEKIISYLDIYQPQVMLEVEMLDVSKGTTDKIGVDWGSAGSYSVNIGSVAQTTAFPYNFLFTSKLGDVTNELTKGNITFPTSLNVVLNFLSTQTDTKYLARPRILTLNNEVAEIKIITQEVVGVKKTVEGTGSASTSTYEAERYETGVSLRVTPQVNLDTNEITMFVVPSVTEATKSVVTGSGGTIYYNPEIRTSRSLIRVKDGETIVVGGLIKNKSSTSSNKIPILGSIPVLGMLFRNKDVDPQQERELLVFITPRIIKDKRVNSAQAKKIVIPAREQGATPLSHRETNIDIALNNLDKKKK
ncbi:MAG: hypothetical protein KJ722_07040 [Candidatus Omnitrophica bacterium]|nr:hypothetical protein [Candidatus Omnitrophota bacterium]